VYFEGRRNHEGRRVITRGGGRRGEEGHRGEEDYEGRGIIEGRRITRGGDSRPKSGT